MSEEQNRNQTHMALICALGEMFGLNSPFFAGRFLLVSTINPNHIFTSPRTLKCLSQNTSAANLHDSIVELWKHPIEQQTFSCLELTPLQHFSQGH